MFLDERFSHRCLLIKRSLISFADRPVPKTLDIFWYGSTTNYVCIFCMRFERIVHNVCADFAPRKLLIVRHYTMACPHSSKRRPCVRVKRLRMRDEDLTAICDRTKKRNQAGISTRAFPLESPSNKTCVKPIRYVLDHLDEWQLIWYGSKVPTKSIMWIEIYAHRFLL